MFLFQACKTSTKLFGESIGQEALMTGISDVIIVKYPNGFYKSTPFLVCFGSHSILHRDKQIQVVINEKNTIKTRKKVNRHGYMNDVHMSQQQIQKMDLHFGKNTIRYVLSDVSMQSDLLLMNITDKILISDFDGTLTISDFGGLLGGVLDYDCVHPGYSDLMKNLSERNVYLIWVTMRSLPFYDCSKRYIQKYIKAPGVLLMQPQQFLPAVKKQLFKKTGNIKANIIKKISQLFPQGVYPLVGGLGNRQNDAIAYLNIGMRMEYIYLVSTKSKVQRMSQTTYGLTYKQMAQNIDLYFRLNSFFF